MVSTYYENRADQARARLPVHLRQWSGALVVATADALAFVLAAMTFCAARGKAPDIASFELFAIFAVLFIGLRALAADYTRRDPFWLGMRGTYVSLFVMSVAAVFVAGAETGVQPQSAGSISLAWLTLVIAIPSTRQLGRALLKRTGLWRRQTALIGSGEAAEKAHESLQASTAMGFDINWFVTIGGDRVPDKLAALKHIEASEISEVGTLLQDVDCDQAIVVLNDSLRTVTGDIAEALNEANIQTAFLPAIGKLPIDNISPNVLFGRNILLFQTRDNLSRWPYRNLKRVFDIIGAAAGVLFLSPFLLIIALLICRDGGPVLYSQERVGLHGRRFRCLKFRTMTVDAEERLHRWRLENPGLFAEYKRTYKLRHDPRVTPLGNFLRRTSLDELPQLLNILRGDMSLVGPRPVVEQELADFYGPAARLYKRVRPGLTGLWQISGRSDTSYDERVAFDEWYILNWSFWFDIVIIGGTFGAVVSGQGAR